MEHKVYLNGEYLPLSKARVSVLDRGFLFGDGVYEVIPAYHGKLFRLEAHLQRLENSLSNIRLGLSYSVEKWREILLPLVDETKDQYIYLQITRGVAPKRDHAFPTSAVPTVFAMCSDIQYFEGREVGVKAVTMDDNRWEMCHVKATTLLANILLRQQAIEQGCAEAILVKNGYVTEGAASNLFVVIDGELMTPAKSADILPGITRDVIIELAQANDIKVNENVISLEALQAADEIWVTSSTREIIPVVELDGQPVADGHPGPLWRKINELFQQYKQSVS
ncbi:D-amino acid aminotransferase [Methylomarinum sp. Ch1-1]|uniref:Aminodeoxychorismate lyase n=1 Tax=Methylomarinum roseum TaxID=3067653 RepID=A0AAU7NVC3_9GAMM|nr:D-amino acid aminotransferase [Methylomarinum sp. Ch1-1]MDP4519025.1 D-amino acid aminotransferase [Methylomarinum sp. Ch1-1]